MVDDVRRSQVADELGRRVWARGRDDAAAARSRELYRERPYAAGRTGHQHDVVRGYVERVDAIERGDAGQPDRRHAHQRVPPSVGAAQGQPFTQHGTTLTANASAPDRGDGRAGRAGLPGYRSNPALTGLPIRLSAASPRVQGGEAP